MLFSVFNLQGQASSAVRVPDENFRNILLNNYGVRETLKGPEWINGDDLALITTLNISGANISDLKGIEVMINLQNLFCSNNAIFELDVSNSLNLTILDCSNNNLSILDVSNMNLESLNVSGNPNLFTVNCVNNKLIALDVSNNPTLNNLYFSSNPNLKSVNITGDSYLEELYISETNISFLDFSTNFFLNKLTFTDNFSSNLQIDNSIVIQNMFINDNPNLTELTINNSSKLHHLFCNNNSILTSLSISNAPDLVSLDCSFNNISDLNISQLNSTVGVGIECNDNNLVNLDTNGVFIVELNCDNNQIESLDLTSNSNLYSLYCEFNKIESLDLTANTNLVNLGCGNNNISNLNLNGLNLLEDLGCNDNDLFNLDISSLVSLTFIDCPNNNLNSLDVSNNTLLEDLICNNNNLYSLDLKGLTELDELSFIDNNLEEIDLSENTLLTWLECAGNNLRELDLTNHALLDYLDCRNNNLERLNIKNGNNNVMLDEDFYAYINPNLTCIQVDNADYSTTNWTNIDGQTSFSELCDLSLSVFNVSSQGNTYDLTLEGLSIAADGSSSTHFLLEGENLDKYSIKIMENKNSEPELYGSFKLEPIENGERKIIYTHPKFMSWPNEQNHPITLQIVNNETVNPEKEYLIKIVRPSLLMVHGIWSNGRDSFGKMHKAFRKNDNYKYYQIIKVNYDGTIFNSKNISVLKRYIETLKDNAILFNTSLEKIDIVAHSNGGLFTRHYIQSGDYLNDVNKFITLNTPHSGTQVANLLLSSGAKGFASNFFFDITSPLTGMAPNGGIISDLRVKEKDSEESFYITWLNNPMKQNMLNYQNIAVKTLTTTTKFAETNLPNVFFGFESLITTFQTFNQLIEFEPSNLFGAKLNKTIASVLRTSMHDLLVPLESQKGGCDSTSNSDNISHTASTENLGFIDKIKTLLDSNPDENFSYKGFSPIVLETDYNSTGTAGKQLQNKSNETISILSPIEGTEYSAGGIVVSEITGSSGILNILAISGSPNSTLQSIPLENTNTGIAQFTIPEDFLGKYNIIGAGFSANGYESYDSTYIIVTTNAILETIEIDQSIIYIEEGSQSVVTILGHYDDGVIRDITYVNDLVYTFNEGNAEIPESGLVSGINEGDDVLTISYLGKSTTVPITVISSIALSIDDVNEKIDNFVVFPNPTQDLLTIKFPVNQTKAEVTIYNFLGQQMFNKEITSTNNELNIVNIESGMYLLKIETEKGIISKRIIKN